MDDLEPYINLVKNEMGGFVHEMANALKLNLGKIGYRFSESPTPYISVNVRNADMLIHKGAIDALQGGNLHSLTSETKAVLAHEVAGHVGKFHPGTWGKFSLCAGPVIAVGAYEIARRFHKRGEKEKTADEIKHLPEESDLPHPLWGVAKYTALAALGLAGGGFVARQMSRHMEFMADRRAVEYTKDPQALISALKKMEEAAENLVKGNQEFFPDLWLKVKNLTYHAHPVLKERIASIETAGRNI